MFSGEGKDNIAVAGHSGNRTVARSASTRHVWPPPLWENEEQAFWCVSDGTGVPGWSTFHILHLQWERFLRKGLELFAEAVLNQKKVPYTLLKMFHIVSIFYMLPISLNFHEVAVIASIADIQTSFAPLISE